MLVREALEDLVELEEEVGVQLRAAERETEREAVAERVRREECVGRGDVVPE